MDRANPTSQRDCRFSDAYRVHYDAIARYLRRRLVGERDSVSDLVAQTFLAAWRHVDDLPSEPLPWLYRIAQLELANFRRATTRQKDLSAPGKSALVEVARDVADAAVERDLLLEAFSTLAEDEQELLRLVAWEGLSSAEGAAVVGCTDGAFRVRLHQARRRLEGVVLALEGGQFPDRLRGPRVDALTAVEVCSSGLAKEE
jgi:RNA polymerase sigma factor (sigma-70 family)